MIQIKQEDEMTFAINLTGGGKKANRRALDFYPTPPDVTNALLKGICFHVPKGMMWEPACGNGTMSEVLKLTGNEVISTDIEGDYADMLLDFTRPVKYPITPRIKAIVTNPPFALSEAFIRKALSFPDVEFVAMLLKSQYWHAKKRGDLFKEFPPAFVLALNWRPDFLNGARGGAPTMECIWTVWIKGITDARYMILEKP